jgi:hypothetical protein
LSYEDEVRHSLDLDMDQEYFLDLKFFLLIKLPHRHLEPQNHPDISSSHHPCLLLLAQVI